MSSNAAGLQTGPGPGAREPQVGLPSTQDCAAQRSRVVQLCSTAQRSRIVQHSLPPTPPAAPSPLPRCWAWTRWSACAWPPPHAARPRSSATRWGGRVERRRKGREALAGKRGRQGCVDFWPPASTRVPWAVSPGFALPPLGGHASMPSQTSDLCCLRLRPHPSFHPSLLLAHSASSASSWPAWRTCCPSTAGRRRPQTCYSSAAPTASPRAQLRQQPRGGCHGTCVSYQVWQALAAAWAEPIACLVRSL